MRNILLAVAAMMCCTTVYADCRQHTLQGDWTVFYRDNAFPTSVLAPAETVSIQYVASRDEYAVDLTDRDWKAWDGTWSHECIDGQSVLIGAIERRNSGALVVIEVSRVIEVDDLLPGRSGYVRLNQINIHFPELHASSYPAELGDALKQGGYLASHPGHAHAYD